MTIEPATTTKARKRHGASSVYTEQRSGKDVLIIDISYRDTTGQQKRYRSQANGSTVADARNEEKRIRQNIAQYGSPYAMGNKSAPLFAEVVKEFESDHLRQKKHSTQLSYKAIIRDRLLPRFGLLRINEIDAPALMSLNATALDDWKLASTSANNIQIICRSILRFARVKKYIAGVPDDLPKLKRHRRTGTAPTVREVQAILDASTPNQRLAFSLICYAGLRPSEVRALRWRDIGASIQVNRAIVRGHEDSPKTGTGRLIPIDPELSRLFPENRPPDDFVCQTKQRKGWSETSMTQAFKRLVRKLGQSSTRRLYDLRHYAASEWLSSGLYGAAEVQQMLGHADLTTTGLYAHARPGSGQQAMDRLASARATHQDA